MDNTKLRNERLANINKTKVKKVGLFEGLGLKISGRIDGSRNLPRESEDGCWLSPFMDKEKRILEEHCDKLWGKLQIEEEQSYSAIGDTMDAIQHTEKQLKAAKGKLDSKLQEASAEDLSRRHGEDKLTDEQIRARRSQEKQEEVEPLKAETEALEKKHHELVVQLSSLYNRVTEDNNSTKMVCRRMKDRVLQRIDIYWNSAMRKHKESSRMPAIPTVRFENVAEETYMAPHKALMEKADSMIHNLHQEYKKEESHV